MSRFVPFTMHIKIEPSYGSGSADPKLKSKRQELIRSLQKISSMIYDSISSISGVELALPGGGQHRSFGGSDHDNSGMVQGMAVKPQFGETPPQVMITGFVTDSNKNIQNYAEMQKISGGEVYEGYSPNSSVVTPESEVDSLASSLISSVKAALASDLPAGVEYKIFRLDIANVIYGDRGYHFP